MTFQLRTVKRETTSAIRRALLTDELGEAGDGKVMVAVYSPM